MAHEHIFQYSLIGITDGHWVVERDINEERLAQQYQKGQLNLSELLKPQSVTDKQVHEQERLLEQLSNYINSDHGLAKSLHAHLLRWADQCTETSDTNDGHVKFDGHILTTTEYYRHLQVPNFRTRINIFKSILYSIGSTADLNMIARLLNVASHVQEIKHQSKQTGKDNQARILIFTHDETLHVPEDTIFWFHEFARYIFQGILTRKDGHTTLLAVLRILQLSK
jgi:hypothetical protein